ncbi:uncharacterized protein LOC118193626 [Stegodyphus dumicola]|uniref:uncharacterized protein LOC118193626 n=1 Tax=Stegodyphus dumicola TaxID=202533 RepID=UPI0015AD163B|nr:uncharacterized protein LOC118193626 [Stegodyphus dumicola]
MAYSSSTEAEASPQLHAMLTSISYNLADYMKKKKMISSALQSVLDVRIESDFVEAGSLGVHQKYLVPFVTSLCLAMCGIAVVIMIFIHKKQKGHRTESACSSLSSNGNKTEHETSSSTNNLVKDNWKRYINKLQTLPDQGSTIVNENMLNTESHFSEIPNKIYKAVSPEINKNIALSLPFKKNFEKNDLNASQKQESFPEQELIV